MDSASSSAANDSIRYHDLDALRAWAMSMGIVLHAAWIMIPGEAGAPATDVSANVWCDWLCLAIHTFRMQLFFVLAGFFACLLLQRRGFVKFASNRIRRILVPLVLFAIVLVPIMVWQYNAGALKSGAVQADTTAWQLTREYFDEISPSNTMLVHLWFLHYLAIAYVIVVGVRYAVAAIDPGRSLRSRVVESFGAAISRPWSLLWLAALFAPLMMPMKGTWGIDIGLATLWPKWPGLLSYCLYFGVGWLIYRNVDRLDSMVQHWRWMLALGLLLTIPYFLYSKGVTQRGYATWNYPKLVVEDIRFDFVAQRPDYPALRSTLLAGEEGSVVNAIQNALPEEHRQFVEDHTKVSDNQLAGLLTAINVSVLGDTGFAEQFDLDGFELTDEQRRIAAQGSGDRSLAETERLNRGIIEAALGGIVHMEDVRRPFYYPMRAAYAYGYSFITWCLIFGCIGAFRTYCSGESRFWRYFSDSSYWMYLLHLPIQFQILLWLSDKPWTGLLKFLVYVVGTSLVLLPSYHFLVRPTWIGWLLNGRTYPIFTSSTGGQYRTVSNDIPAPVTHSTDKVTTV